MVGRHKSYPEYKSSGVDWFGNIPKSWTLTRLKFEANINMGQSPSSDDCNQDGVGMPFLQGNAEFGLLNPSPKQYCEIPRKIASKGQLLFSVRAPVGALNIADQSYGIGRGLCAIDGGGGILNDFLWWLIPVVRPDLDAISTGSTFEAVSVEQVENLYFYRPSQSEQRTISKFLDLEISKIDALINKQQSLIQLLKEKRQTVISQAVTKGLNPNVRMRDSGVEWLGLVPEHWHVKRLKNTSKVIDCRNKTPEYFVDGEYFVVRTTNVKKQTLTMDGALFTDEKNYKVWTQRGVPPAGSILFTREAPAGEVCLVPEGVNFCLGQRMMNFICDDERYTNFLFDFLLSDCLGVYINSVSHGSTVSHLRVEQVENIPVLVPPLAESEQIHEYLSAIKLKYSKLTQGAEMAITLMRERRAALISAAVTGKIDLRDWVFSEDNLHNKEVAA